MLNSNSFDKLHALQAKLQSSVNFFFVNLNTLREFQKN